MLDFLLDCLLQEVIDGLVVFKDVLDVKFMLFVQFPQLTAYLVVEVACDECQLSIFIKI